MFLKILNVKIWIITFSVLKYIFVGFQKNALYKATTVQTCHENTNTQLHFIKTIGVADLYQSIFQDFLINLLAFVLMFAYLSLAI